MTLKAEITYLSNGQLDTAREIVVDGQVRFDNLMEVNEVASPALYAEIEDILTQMAHDKWVAEGEELAEERRWARNR